MLSGAGTLKNSLAVFLKAKFTNIMEFINQTPRHLSREMKTYVHKQTCMQMFIAALFVITKIWEQPKCSIIC